MNENHAPMVLSDEVMIEIIHSIKDVLIHLTDALFPSFLGQALGIYFLLIFEGEVDADDSVDCAVVYRRIPVL